MRDASGRLARVVGAARDVAEQRLLEEQVLHAQKMEAVAQLAGGIAHDFNNILTAIQGNAELLLGEASGDPVLRDGLEEVDQAAVRAASLMRQLLAFGRRQMVQPRLVDTNAVVRDMGRMLRQLIGEHIELDTTLDPAPDLVLVDRGQLEQVVVKRARPLRPRMRVHYVSGYTDDAILRHGVLRDEVDLVDKPFFPATLTQAVRRALGDRPAPA